MKNKQGNVNTKFLSFVLKKTIAAGTAPASHGRQPCILTFVLCDHVKSGIRTHEAYALSLKDSPFNHSGILTVNIEFLHPMLN